jgi:hypothetical protein
MVVTGLDPWSKGIVIAYIATIGCGCALQQLMSVADLHSYCDPIFDK